MLFLDVETQNTFADTNDYTTRGLKISYVGVIDDNGNKEMDFWESDMEMLGSIMKTADVIVGYNIFSFDMPVISNYLGADVLNLPMLDLMVAMKKKIGFRPKLDDLTNATLGHGKIGHGLDAVKYYANGELDKLKKYCMEDVRITKDLYYFGLKNGFVKYYDKNGFMQQTNIDWNLGRKEEEVVEAPAPQNLSLF